MTYELHPRCGNYVALFGDISQIKFGYSTDLERRFKEYERLAASYGISAPEWREFTTLKGIAKIAEAEMRQDLKGMTIPGSFEWIKGGSSLFKVLCERVIRTQSDVCVTLGVSA